MAGLSPDLDSLRHRVVPSHMAVGAEYPPTELQDVYARGQYGLSDIKNPPVHASVLVPLRLEPSSGELVVILTRRTRRLKRHAGEVALPGGKRDAADGLSDRTTALREAAEEIGLHSDDVLEVLCELERPVAVGGIITGVVVATVSPMFKPVANPNEVDAVFEMPLRAFVEGGEAWEYRAEDLKPNVADDCEGNHGRRPMRTHYFTQRGGTLATSNEADSAVANEYLVWGLTSGILIHVAELVFGTAPAFQKNSPMAPPKTTGGASL